MSEHTAEKGLLRRTEQIGATATRVACTELGIYKAFLPDVVSPDVVIAAADLAWLLAVARDHARVTPPGSGDAESGDGQ